MDEKRLAVALAQARIGFGIVSLLAPGPLARAMTGRSDGAARLFVRMVGARDLGVGLGLQAALNRDAPTRGWLEASAAVDGIDAVAFLLARHHLRPLVLPGTLGAAAGGALLSAWLARQVDRNSRAKAQSAGSATSRTTSTVSRTLSAPIIPR